MVSSPEIKFGKDRRADFMLEDGYVPLNHGSFGAYPTSVMPLVHAYQRQAEMNPDKWLRIDVFPLLHKNLARLATLVKADPNDMTFVNNASTGVNAVLRSIPMDPGDTILCFNTAYNAVGKTLAFIQDTRQIKLALVNLAYPINDDDVVSAVEEAVAQHPRIRLCVMDAISSVPGVRFPFERVIRDVLKPAGIPSLVDGAHAMGQIPLNLTEADPDFFVGNCHKWLFVPRGVGILYVAPRQQSNVHPTVINVSYTPHTETAAMGAPSMPGGDVGSAFQREFAWPGTIDFSNYVCVEAALDYRESLGGEEAIQTYCHTLALRGGARMAEIFGTEIMENDARTLTCAMVNVRLPPLHTTRSEGDLTNLFIHKLLEEHHCMATVYKHGDHWYARCSAQIYNTVEDFEHVADAILKVCKSI